MKLSKLFLLAMLGLFMLNSCGDDDESPSDLLTKGEWSLSDTRSDTDGDGTLESDIEDCSKDDTIDFNDDGTYGTDEGATKCDESDPQTTSGTWELSSDNKMLTITEGSISSTAEVVSLTDSRLELKIEFEFLGYIIISEAVYTR